MNTTKKRGRPAGKSRCECSCISYLSTESLKVQLDTLVLKGAIQHYWFVQHEPDEEAKKPHHHLRMLPPVAQGVVWADLCKTIVETVPGEPSPRALVLYNGSVNDCWQDALLYARHDSRYLVAKGETKAHVDYPMDAFVTDSREWLEQIWLAADSYVPAPRRMSKEEVMVMLDNCDGAISNRQLLRVVMANGYQLGDYHLFDRYALECRRDAAKRKEVEAERAKHEPMLPMEGL